MQHPIDNILPVLAAHTTAVERLMGNQTEVLGNRLDKVQNEMTFMGAVNTIRRFDGSPKNFKGWISKIEKHKMIMGGEAEMGIRLALSTSDGAASDWIRMYWAEKKAQRVDLDWNDFKTTLQTRFGEADSDTAALDHLTRMTRAAKEPVAMFGERVHVAAREAFGAEGIANPVAQSVALLTFMRGCKSPSLVRSLCRNKPATLLEAVNRAGEEAVLQHQINTMINGPETDKDHQGFEAMDVDLIHRDEEQSENDTQETETSQRSGTSGDSSNTMLSGKF